MKTRIYKVTSAGSPLISEAADILSQGGIVAIPTETVYGLAGNALDGSVTKKIYEAKGRPSDNPLIVHISELSQWAPLVRSIPESALSLAEKFWPGPLTIILPKSELIPDEVSGGLDTVAVRMPDNDIARQIITQAGVPLAAPSANLSGKPSPTSASHVIADLSGKIDAVVDGGDCKVGVESTVLSLAVTPPRILRPGGITPEMLTEVLGEVEIDDAVYAKLREGETAASPGMKYKHYAPKAQIILVRAELDKFISYAVENKTEKTLVLCFEDEEKDIPLDTVTYGKKDDPLSQAKHIFDALRKIDELGADRVFARYPEKDGVGLAVFNRLIRAAGFNEIEL